MPNDPVQAAAEGLAAFQAVTPDAVPPSPRIREKGGLLFLALRPNDRPTLATTIEALIDLADACEPDPDLEPFMGGYSGSGDDREGDDDERLFGSSFGTAGCEDDEPTGDDEPSLGWGDTVNQRAFGRCGGSDDREDADEREPDDTDLIGFGWANNKPGMPQEGLMRFNPIGRATKAMPRMWVAANGNDPCVAEAVALYRQLTPEGKAFALGFASGLLAGEDRS